MLVERHGQLVGERAGVGRIDEPSSRMAVAGAAAAAAVAGVMAGAEPTAGGWAGDHRQSLRIQPARDGRGAPSPRRRRAVPRRPSSQRRDSRLIPR